MSLYIDKFRLNSFDDVKFNKNIAENLKKFAKFDNISHLMLIGSNGSGRNTFANLYIDYKYGNGGQVVRHTKNIIIKNKTNSSKNVRIIYSNYHIQLNPCQYGVYDRSIIKKYINDKIKTISSSNKYITIVIENADKLSIDAQESLRRTLEINMTTCRFIFLVDQLSTIIDPLISRFVQFRLSQPKNNQIFNYLKEINLKISNTSPITINIPNDNDILLITEKSNRNLKEAINGLNLFHIFGKIIDSENEKIEEIIKIISNNFTPKMIEQLRSILFDLLVHCIDPCQISKFIYNKLTNEFKFDNLTYELITLELATCNDNLRDCNKPIYHLERFCIFIAKTLIK